MTTAQNTPVENPEARVRIWTHDAVCQQYTAEHGRIDVQLPLNPVFSADCQLARLYWRNPETGGHYDADGGCGTVAQLMEHYRRYLPEQQVQWMDSGIYTPDYSGFQVTDPYAPNQE